MIASAEIVAGVVRMNTSIFLDGFGLSRRWGTPADAQPFPGAKLSARTTRKSPLSSQSHHDNSAIRPRRWHPTRYAAEHKPALREKRRP